MKMKLYLLVTEDEYELPLVVAESLTELSEILQIPKNRITSAISHAKRRGYRSKYVKVEC